jgi:hypothetical protein
MIRYVLIGVILLLQACASPIYYARQVHGQVVDDETGKPLEGVIVLAEWILFRKGLGEGWTDQRLRVFETVTDKNGNYVISGSPMIRLSPFTELHHPRDPEISFFKKGYTVLSVDNFSFSQNSVIRGSMWNGKVLRLKHFNGSKERRAHSLSVLFNFDGYREWRHVPILLQAMFEEKKRLVSEGIKPWLLSNIPDINDVLVQEVLKGDLNEE